MADTETNEALYAVGHDGKPTNARIHAKILDDGEAGEDVASERAEAVADGMPQDVADLLFQED